MNLFDEEHLRAATATAVPIAGILDTLWKPFRAAADKPRANMDSAALGACDGRIRRREVHLRRVRGPPSPKPDPPGQLRKNPNFCTRAADMYRKSDFLYKSQRQEGENGDHRAT
jgi:hypothetical protein